MAEEQRPRPPLQEIPNRPYKIAGEASDEEGKILTLIKSIKENLDVKMIALRRDIDRQTHDEIAREINVMQEEMEKIRSNGEDSHAVLTAKIAGLGASLMEKIDAKLAGLKNEIDAKEDDHDAVEIAQIREELEAGRTDGQLARASLAARIEGLAVKVDAIAAAPAEEVARLKQSVEANLKQVQALVSSFDLPAFVNEIRQMYSEKLSHAEEKLKALAAQLARVEQENDQLKQTLAEKDLQLKQVSTSKIDSHPQQSSRPEASQATPERVARVASPRAQHWSQPIDSTTDEEIPFPEPVAQRKAASFCVNCGKPRSTSYSRYCIFCGAEFQ